MVDKKDLRAVHWEFGHSKVQYESETTERFMNEARDKMVRDAIRSKEEPESLQLGKVLRQSHIQLSLRADQQPPKTETRISYQQRKAEITKGFADTNGEELRRSNIDLGVAGNKSGRDWSSVLKSSMSQAADKKFACEKPQGFEELGVELRKSNVLLHAGRHDFRSSSLPIARSETKIQYGLKPASPTQGYAETLGKQLRTSSIDVAGGGSRASADWQSQQHTTMLEQNDDKWACKKPEGFYHLIAELRKTNVTLGTDRTNYEKKAAFTHRELKQSDRLRPAGHVPGV